MSPVVPRDIVVGRAGGGFHRLRLRPCTRVDVRQLTGVWAPALELGPAGWLDREWSWGGLDASDQLAFDVNPVCWVLADEAEPDASGDVLGILVTTGVIDPGLALLDTAQIGTGGVVWVEYIAIAPSIRPDCPVRECRQVLLKGLGPSLMAAAIQRSLALGCEGRVGLHAEGDGAKRTYKEKWGMQELPEANHPAGGRFPVFFGSATWARTFMEQRKA